MAPTADGLVEAISEIAPSPAMLGESVGALGADADDIAADDSEAFDLRQMLHALQAMRVGDFSVRLPGDQIGLAGKIADTFNEIVAANERMAQQLEHVGQVVGREGKTRQRVQVRPCRTAPGARWKPRSTR